MRNNWRTLYSLLMTAILAVFAAACESNTFETTEPTEAIEETVEATEIVEPTREQTPVPEETEEPTPVVVDDTDFEYAVRSNLDRSWATIEDADTMSRLQVSRQFRDLLAGGMVATDEDGEAQLRAEGCQDLYVYKASGFLFAPDQLVVRPCSQAEAGDATCSGSSTLSFDDCKLTVQTTDARVTWETTWLTVTFDEALDLTLVTVHEGEVTLQQTIGPERTRARRAPNLEDFEPVGEAVVVPEGQFAYSVPEENMAEVAQFTGILPLTPLPLDEIAPMIGILGLDERFQRVNQKLLSVDLLPAMPVHYAPVIRVRSGFLEEAPVQEAFLVGVDWNALLDEVFPATNFPVQYEGSQVNQNVRLSTYDPDLAQAYLEEMGLQGQFFVYVAYVEGDSQLERIARGAAQYLERIGAPAELLAIPPGGSQEFSFDDSVMIIDWR